MVIIGGLFFIISPIRLLMVSPRALPSVSGPQRWSSVALGCMALFMALPGVYERYLSLERRWGGFDRGPSGARILRISMIIIGTVMLLWR